MIPDPLLCALRDLVRELQGTGIRLIVGGGYGLVLRAQHIASTNVRTRRPLPRTRGTEDIDCFLNGEIITSVESTAAIRSALDRLEYKPKTPHLQFTRTFDHNGSPLTTRVDFLAAPVSGSDREKVRVTDIRISPRSRASTKLHAYITPAAFSIEEGLLPVDVSEDASGWIVYLPHPFSYLVLKIIALRNLLSSAESQEAKYHALDLYTIWTTITEPEWGQAEEMRDRFAAHAVMADARQALEQLFDTRESLGVLALKDQARKQEIDLTEEDVAEFLIDLRQLLVGTI